MDDESMYSSLSLPPTYLKVGLSNIHNQNNKHLSLLKNKRLPYIGWSDSQILNFMSIFATLDTNSDIPIKTSGDVYNYDFSSDEELVKINIVKKHRWTGVGEREGRVYSPLVYSRHYGLSHGMGRSGNLNESQPKATGSTALLNIATSLVLDVMRRGSNLDRNVTTSGILLPMCTGMSLSLIIRSLENRGGIILWSRMDQKSCLKAIYTAGVECIVIPTCVKGDEVVTDVIILKELLKKHGRNVRAVICTTSCFAPRVPDAVDDVARLCRHHTIPHIINHAYGLQCRKTCKLISRACTVGRVDAIVCSLDKNFLIPVGGCIVISPRSSIIERIGCVYPGRGCITPVVDLVITLLSMGLNGFQQLLYKRERLSLKFQRRLSKIATMYGERTLICPKNSISFAMTLNRLPKEMTSFLGSMLFLRCISGTRVVTLGQEKVLYGHNFLGYGSSTHSYPHSYLTSACAIGLEGIEMEDFFIRLDKCFKEVLKRKKFQKNEIKKEDIFKKKNIIKIK